MFFSDLPDDPDNPNGPTIREANLKRSHSIPIDSLVELDISSWLGNGVCVSGKARLFVVRHDRDCDGTPLYSVATFKMSDFGSMEVIRSLSELALTGIGEEALTVVKVTPDIVSGNDIPEWLKE